MRATGDGAPAATARVPAMAGRATRSDAVVIAALVALVSLPLVIAAVALRRPVWAPVLDLAMTELRVRDVGGPDSPLIGLPGRIGGDGVQGSHPGPLSFWLLAPVYRLAGSTAWALHVAVAALDVVAIAVALVLAQRRGGRVLAAAVALALALLVVGYGLGPLLEPWNPYVSLLWWVVFLLSLWSVLCRDWPMLPLVVTSGTFAAQTHVPYLGLCVVLGLLGLGAALHGWRNALPGERRSIRRWTIAGAALAALLWLPPTIDQVAHDPGNYELLVDHFGTPPEDPVGLSRAAGEVLEHFDVGHLVIDQLRTPGLLARGELGRFPVAWRGAVLLAAWAITAAVAWRWSPAALRRLHLSLAAATVVGCYSISRIFGVVWYYLMLWLWAVAALAVVASAWSIVVVVRGRRSARAPSPTRHRPRWALPALVAATAVLTVRSVVVAPDAEPSDVRPSRVLAALVGPTVDALEEDVGASDGRTGRYLVGFSDALHFGAQAYGLVNELERRGFDVGMEPAFAVPVTEHRTLTEDDATARIELVTGRNIDLWRGVEGAIEVATVDLRTREELDELEELRESVTAKLEQEGLGELVPVLTTNLFAAAIDQRASQALRVDIDRMLKIGMPTSVFVAPPSVERP